MQSGSYKNDSSTLGEKYHFHTVSTHVCLATSTSTVSCQLIRCLPFCAAGWSGEGKLGMEPLPCVEGAVYMTVDCSVKAYFVEAVMRLGKCCVRSILPGISSSVRVSHKALFSSKTLVTSLLWNKV